MNNGKFVYLMLNHWDWMGDVLLFLRSFDFCGFSLQIFSKVMKAMQKVIVPKINCMRRLDIIDPIYLIINPLFYLLHI